MIDPNSIPILHPFSYDLRSDAVRLKNRSDTAGDTAQAAAITLAFTEAETAIAASTTIRRDEFTADPTGHLGIHLKWLLSDQVYRALESADIATDFATIKAAVTP